jgi:hypothetical protein
VAKLVDARDLSKLSALRETERAELPKFGETGNKQSGAKRSGRTTGEKVTSTTFPKFESYQAA